MPKSEQPESKPKWAEDVKMVRASAIDDSSNARRKLKELASPSEKRDKAGIYSTLSKSYPNYRLHPRSGHLKKVRRL